MTLTRAKGCKADAGHGLSPQPPLRSLISTASSPPSLLSRLFTLPPPPVSAIVFSRNSVPSTRTHHRRPFTGPPPPRSSTSSSPADVNIQTPSGGSRLRVFRVNGATYTHHPRPAVVTCDRRNGGMGVCAGEVEGGKTVFFPLKNRLPCRPSPTLVSLLVPPSPLH